MASDGEISCANDPNFAVIYSFLKTFGKLYGVDVPTISKLQEFIENTQEVLDPLKELHLRLLRRAHKTVPSNRWERFMIKFCHQQGHHQEAWEIERFSYKKASTQVKLKVLKLLLEFQFTCHPKFKNAVNAISCKELRLDPIGRDKNGCVYWLQVDHEANLCLYKEDQDEETWQLVARTREELVKVIAQLKSGEEVCPLSMCNSNVNEDSSSAEVPPLLESNKSEDEEENEEEFLSPESESEHEPDEQKDDEDLKDTDKEATQPEDSIDNKEEEKKEVTKNTDSPTETTEMPEAEEKAEPLEQGREAESPKTDETLETPEQSKEPTSKELASKEPTSKELTIKEPTSKEPTSKELPIKEPISKEPTSKEPTIKEPTSKEPTIKEPTSKEDNKEEEVGEAIEEPVMLVTGEGNGADCESSYIIGEEISEPVMYFYGEGWGYDNDTGNPETIEQAHSPEENSAEENGNEECLNGELSHELSNSSNKNKLGKNIKLKSSLPSVAKRSLKKQSNDTTEVLSSDSKKHCVRDLDQSDGSNTIKNTEKDLKRESSVNDKSTTDSESPKKNNVKKGRGKVKKKSNIARNLKLNKSTEVANSETDNCHDSKTSIIEKRKSSVSSVDQEDAVNTENEKEKSPDKETKVEDSLPPKKLRLENTPESDVNTHSKERGVSVEKDSLNNVESNPVAQRKKIKANKGKFKRKKVPKKIDDNVDKNSDKETANDNGKKECKSLKRSLLDATMSDKNKSESQTESEDDEPITSGKRLKIKPKKIITSTRKKVEAKLLEKHSSDESEEETLYSIAGKKSPKKLVKKKNKIKEKGKSEKGKSGRTSGRAASDDSDAAPVRQSRRIAQMKIKEEADRRHLEEVTLRELKKIHKKKNKEEEEEEEEWRASGASSSDGERRRRKAEWRSDHSTGPEPDSDSDEPLFEIHEEPDLVFNKSDHEFSPESDLESGEPVEPTKRARTLQEGKEDADGFCKRCGSGEQPEWILLCDKCDAGYHASCLKPLLFVVPEGDWFCPPCNHDMLIASLEAELVKYDELVLAVEAEKERKKLEQPEPENQKESEDEKLIQTKEEDDKSSEASASSEWSSTSEEGAVYRLRARRQLPVSYRSQEYDRLISSAIKEEYVEATTSAGNQGRGKDISTIIEAAEEEKMKAEREAMEQGKPIEKKIKKKQRRKPRKLNSLEVPSEDDDETDEDFKDTGAYSMESSSEEISSSAERDGSSDSRSSDSLPIRRTCRSDKKERPKMTESSPEVKKKKKGLLEDSSSESAGAKEWSSKSKSKSKSRPPKSKHRDKSKKRRKRSGLTQYDAEGNVIRARVTYGGLSGDEGINDWSPKHRTRQKKINYTEMPNTESEDEMHKSSGKHMPDSSDEYKIDTDATTDSEEDRAKRKKHEEEEQSNEEKRKALSDLIKKTAVVPLEKLPEDVTKAKTEELQAHLNAQAAMNARPNRGRGSRGGRGSRAARGRGRGDHSTAAAAAGASDDALAKLIGVKIKDLRTDGSPMKPNQAEREKKRQEREAKRAEREAKKLERLQKKEEKEKMKEQKAKEREEKRLARLAMQETKRLKKEKMEFPVGAAMAYGPGGPAPRPHGFGPPPPPQPQPRMHNDFHEQPRFPTTPRLQVRAELRGVAPGAPRAAHAAHQHTTNAHREGTLSVAGSPQPFKPITEEPSIITRMPHMINQQYRGPMMYPGGASYGPRGQNMSMYGLHPALGAARQFPQYYGHVRPLPPTHPGHPHPAAYPPRAPYSTASSPAPPAAPHPAMARPHAPPGHMPPAGHGPPAHGPPPPGHGPMPPGHGPPTSSHGPSPPGHGPPPHGPSPSGHGPPSHGPSPSGHGHLPHGPSPSGQGPPPHGTSPLGHGPSPHGPSPLSHGPSPHGPSPLGHGPSPHGPSPLGHGPSPHGHPPHGPSPTGHGHPPHGPSPTGHGHPPHGPSPTGHGPPPHGPPHPGHGPLGLHRPHAPGPPGALPPTSSPHGPPGPGAPLTMVRGLPPGLGGLLAPPSASPAAPPRSTPPPDHEPPVRIKAEVKTEPEYHSPIASPVREPSPAPPRDEPPRHPKIKHTENKDRRPRYPLGPYAPQYGPYGPYAPPPGPADRGAPPGPRGPPPMHHPYGPEMRPRSPVTSERLPPHPMEPGHGPPSGPPYLPPHLRPLARPPYGPPAGGRGSPAAPPPYPAPHYAAVSRTSPGGPLPLSVREPVAGPRPEPLASPARLEPLGVVKQEVLSIVKPGSPLSPGAEHPGRAPGPPAGPPAGREEGSVFGGLVSYFSSQHEDDMDA